MNIYKPRPYSYPEIRIGENGNAIMPIPKSIWNDDEIRFGMEHSLKRTEEQIARITKCVQGLQPLLHLTIDCSQPFQFPETVVRSIECGGSYNKELMLFAHYGYMALKEHFDGDEWADWFVAPYFPAGDDLREQFRLGLFVGVPEEADLNARVSSEDRVE